MPLFHCRPRSRRIIDSCGPRPTFRAAGGRYLSHPRRFTMLVRRGFLALVALLAVATAALPAGDPKSPEPFFIKDGDTVVMMGDSITEQHLYSNYVEMWTVSRFPAWKLTFRNVGIGGDRSPGG